MFVNGTATFRCSATHNYQLEFVWTMLSANVPRFSNSQLAFVWTMQAQSRQMFTQMNAVTRTQARIVGWVVQPGRNLHMCPHSQRGEFVFVGLLLSPTLLIVLDNSIVFLIRLDRRLQSHPAVPSGKQSILCCSAPCLPWTLLPISPFPRCLAASTVHPPGVRCP